MEPVIRNSQLFSFDISAIAQLMRLPTALSPNGLTGEEACVLMRYAGMSPNINTIGIYGYDESQDRDGLTAKQISQMIWYVMDGRSRGQREASLEEEGSFNEFHTGICRSGNHFFAKQKNRSMVDAASR